MHKMHVTFSKIREGLCVKFKTSVKRRVFAEMIIRRENTFRPVRSPKANCSYTSIRFSQIARRRDEETDKAACKRFRPTCKYFNIQLLQVCAFPRNNIMPRAKRRKKKRFEILVVACRPRGVWCLHNINRLSINTLGHDLNNFCFYYTTDCFFITVR